jgi:hypothetical protein
MKIKSEVLTVLNDSRLENNVLFLPDTQLERKLYVEVNKVLGLLGGQWNRKIKGHIFTEDVEEMLNDAINFGEITDTKKEYQFFPTPKNIALQLIRLAEIKKTDCVLEPSAGDGAIVKELLKKSTNVHAIEIVDRKELLDLLLSYIHADFFSCRPAPLYDKIVMNPPFSKQQDIDHILYAFKFLKVGGILVSIVSESPFFRINKKSIEFREWLESNNAEIIDLEPGAFKESGTMVKTRIIKIIKKD